MKVAIELIEKDIERNKILMQVDGEDKYSNNVISLNKALNLILNNNVTDAQLVLFDKFIDGLDTSDYEKSKKAYDKLMKILPDNHVQRRVLDMQIRQFPQERKN